MAPPTLPPRPPRKKIKQEIKTEPIEQVWMDQHVSNMGEEFSRPVQTIKREPNADFAAPSNIGGYLTQILMVEYPVMFVAKLFHA